MWPFRSRSSPLPDLVPDRRLPDLVPAGAPHQRIAWINDDGTLGRTNLLDGGETTAAQRRASRSNADLVELYGAVFAAMRRRMRMITRPRVTLMRLRANGEREELPGHPALFALRRVNGSLTTRQGFGLIEQHKLATGMGYWVKRRNRLGVPVEFEIWNPLEVVVIRDRRKPWEPAAFRRYLPNGDTITVDRQDVIFFRHMVDPREPLRGLSPISAARVSLDTGMEAQRWNRAFFDNNALPSAILTGDEIGPAELARINSEIARHHQGTDKAHQVLALEGDLKLLAAPISQKDMQWIEQQQWTVEEVARVFELSPITLADLRHGTYSNVEQADAADWAMIQDQLDNTLAELNEFYVWPDFGDEFELVALYDDIPALQADRKQQAEIDEIYLRTGKVTINQLRERDHEESVPWGETPIMPNTMAPLALASDGSAEDAGVPDAPADEAGAAEEPDAGRGLVASLLEGSGDAVDVAFRRSLRAAEGKLEDETARMLRLEMRLLFTYLDDLGELTVADIAHHDWRGWYERHHGDLAAAIARVFLATLQEAGYPAGTLVDAQQLSVRYASARAGELLRLDTPQSVTATTRTRVRELVARTLEEGQSLRWLKNELRGDGLSFGDSRALTIARTETAIAQGEGKLQSFIAIGYEGKRWVTARGCTHALCVGNERAGAIPLAHLFPSGHRTVPGHPNCLCTLLPANHLDDPAPVALG